MKKHLSFIIVALLLSTVVHAQEWVGFGNRAEGTPPEISVSRSDNQQVSFTVSLSGMYTTPKTEGTQNFTRLSIPECNTAGEVGTPEVPIVTKMIAIPECNEIQCFVTMSGQQTFSSYTIYPVPFHEIKTNGDGYVYWEEVFTIDTAVYAQSIAMPAGNYITLDTGYLRSQRYLLLQLHPIQYNPVAGTLSVATEMEITLQFINATTEVNLPLGIFNNIAANNILNFVDQDIKASVNDKAFERAGFKQGNVQWKRISNPQHVLNITADYLIVCANAFFSGSKPHDEVLRIANHRAQYNGFDVLILNVNDIISDGTGFIYEGNPNPNGNPDEFKKEQRIRTCIRTIYETGTARNTLDGKLGYVLLIGEVGTENTGMPSSKDHGVSGIEEMISDYYFSCITKGSNGIYDRFGDLFIGRFCVPNNLNTGDNGGLTRLNNIIEKTIYFETEYHNLPWKKHVIFANDEMGITQINQISGQIQMALHDQKYTHINRYYYDLPTLRQKILEE